MTGAKHEQAARPASGKFSVLTPKFLSCRSYVGAEQSASTCPKMILHEHAHPSDQGHDTRRGQRRSKGHDSFRPKVDRPGEAGNHTQWVKIWALLASGYLLCRIALSYGVYGSPVIGVELWAGLAIVPLFQAAVMLCLTPTPGTTPPHRWLARMLRAHFATALFLFLDVAVVSAGLGFAASWARLGRSQTLADYYYATKIFIVGAALLLSILRSRQRILTPFFGLVTAVAFIALGAKHILRWEVGDAFYGVWISLAALAGLRFQTKLKIFQPDAIRLCKWTALLLLPAALIAASAFSSVSRLSPIWISAMMSLVLGAVTAIWLLLHSGESTQVSAAPR